MQKRDYLMSSLIVFMTIFLVVGHMPTFLAQNDTDNSGSGSDDSTTDNSGSNDDSDDASETDDDSDDEKEEDDDSDDDNESNGARERFRERTREVFVEGNCTIKIEKKVEIKDGKRKEEIKKKIKCADGTESELELRIENRTEDGRFRERIKYQFKGEELEVEAEDDIDLEEEISGTEYRLKAKLRNGNETRIKIMPGTASEIALERLRALNFTIELRERLDDRNVPRVVYNIEANKPGRFLGIFKIAMKSSAEVDPETGELLETNVPWWAFLVAETDETTDDSDNGNQTDTNDTSDDTFLEGTVNESSNDTDNAAA